MTTLALRRGLTVMAGAWCALLAQNAALADDGPPPTSPVEFNRHIRPILSEKCFRCHGPDARQRKADLRLDEPRAALGQEGGVPAIVPGKPDESELLLRVATTDAAERMPPPEAGKELSASEVALLRAWIAQGAEYQPHWAFVRPHAALPPLIPPNAADRVRNPIDAFVLSRLAAEGLPLSPEATRATLLRRVTLDLTGLPPTAAELAGFLEDDSPEAYEKLVDRLLASPRFGEHLAVDWLDAARYSDTNGYFTDAERKMWPWRDWVIHALNANIPFDQFTIEQLAGDLLPGSTRDQQVATGFHRNHMMNDETGIIDEEFRVEYVADRTDTTGTVWMGLTLGCARCHDHKYDPITQAEYYQLFAFFNNVPEKGTIVSEVPTDPTLSLLSPQEEQSRETLRRAREQTEKEFAAHEAALDEAVARWEPTLQESLPAPAAEGVLARFDFNDRLAESADRPVQTEAVGPIRYKEGFAGLALEFDGSQHVKVTSPTELNPAGPWTVSFWLRPLPIQSGGIAAFPSANDPNRGLFLSTERLQVAVSLGDRTGAAATAIVTTQPLTKAKWQHIAVTSDGSGNPQGLTIYVDGTLRPTSVVADGLDVPLSGGRTWNLGGDGVALGLNGRIDELRIDQRALSAAEIQTLYDLDVLAGVVPMSADKRSAAQKDQLRDAWVRRHAPEELRTLWRRLLDLRRQEAEFDAAIPKALVMREMDSPRETFVLERGVYDKHGSPVRADVPAWLPPFPTDLPRNRLGLAQWLVSPGNPLTARVTVNRLWQHFFGEGLVRTGNDFGSQGEWPTHPELLDWLANEFANCGLPTADCGLALSRPDLSNPQSAIPNPQSNAWDVKRLLRLLVTSAAYRQSSALSAELRARDPENRLLARGPRLRLGAEAVRDQALAAGGLLVEQVGGPSVKPYQPPGLWEAVSYNAEQSYIEDQGAGLFRRSLYTFLKRQAPPPAMLYFDGPTRETCTVKRARTNTPLQALVLQNDPTYIEAARALASRVLREAPADARARIDFAVRRVLARVPDNDETQVLLGLLAAQQEEYRHAPQAARALLSVGASHPAADLDVIDLAAWTATVSALLNLDEAITRQ